MNAENHPQSLTDGDEEELINKLADAYKHTETLDSEEWVRIIAEKTNRILAEHPPEECPAKSTL